MMRITLYTKPECSLCDEVRDVIDAVRKRHFFELEIRNILDDLADYERYKHNIPVVMLNGKVIARYRLSEAEFELSLKEADQR